MNILAIIPARGGSKTIPKKNMKLLNGKPLIYYSIIEAQKSKMITDLVVSSDSDKILSISQKYKCDVLKRPKAISNDNTPMWPVAKHALMNLEKVNNKIYDYVLILQPTTPFRRYRDIDCSLKKLIREKSSSLVSVTKMLDGHPARMYKVKEKKLISLNPNLSSQNRQKLPLVFHRNGAIYATKRNIIMRNKILGEDLSYYEMKKDLSVNIDDKIDWKIAKLIMSNENIKS
jgi:CMP-N,N'-diacetyllegionaminic acid synthase